MCRFHLIIQLNICIFDQLWPGAAQQYAKYIYVQVNAPMDHTHLYQENLNKRSLNVVAWNARNISQNNENHPTILKNNLDNVVLNKHFVDKIVTNWMLWSVLLNLEQDKQYQYFIVIENILLLSLFLANFI